MKHYSNTMVPRIMCMEQTWESERSLEIISHSFSHTFTPKSVTLRHRRVTDFGQTLFDRKDI